MAAGLPVVGTSVCGTDEVVIDRVTGRLIPAGDAAALAAALLEALARPDLAARWGAAGRARVAREFSAPRMARETATIYEDLLGERRARRETGPAE
jgi:glycosyltransferase involved in cell wall biosynthesis